MKLNIFNLFQVAMSTILLFSISRLAYGADANSISINSYADLEDALKGQTNIVLVLQKDIITDSEIIFSTEDAPEISVQIDLNGHKLRTSSAMRNNCNLTIRDSVGKGELNISQLYNSKQFTLESGHVINVGSVPIATVSQLHYIGKAFIISTKDSTLNFLGGTVSADTADMNAIFILGGKCIVEDTTIAVTGNNSSAILCRNHFHLQGVSETDEDGKSRGWTETVITPSTLNIRSSDIYIIGDNVIGVNTGNSKLGFPCEDVTINGGQIQAQGKGAVAVFYAGKEPFFLTGTIYGEKAAMESHRQHNQGSDYNPGYTDKNNNVITIQANTQLLSIPFSDVLWSDWHREPILTIAEAKVVTGYPDGTFRPNENVTRAEFVAMLARLSGESRADDVSQSITFSDVSVDSWMHGSVTWTVQNDIVLGMTDTEFAPNQTITRQEAAVMCYRYLKSNESVLREPSTSGFKDSDSIASWATEAVSYCASIGLVNGYSDGTFQPNEPCTRAQAAAMLQHLLEMNESLN